LLEARVKPWDPAQYRVLATDDMGNGCFTCRNQLRSDIPAIVPAVRTARAEVFRERAGNVIPYFDGQAHQFPRIPMGL
jgi:hypothetical protein